jgi:hypothetical protein
MTADRIRGVRLKIERAKEHIRDLDAAIGDFLRDGAYRLGAKPHPVAEIKHTTLYVAEVKPIPSRLSLLIGDAIHNLRSALDHLAWQLVEAGGGVPDRNTYFPICETSQQYASAIGKGEILKIAPEARNMIQLVQPYVTMEQTLWLIHYLDIVDKHRLLLTVASAMDRWGVDFTLGARMWFHEDRFVPLVVGSEITNLPTSTYERQPHEDFKLGLEVAFAESEIPEGELVLHTLNKMVDFIDGLVGSFEPFLV